MNTFTFSYTDESVTLRLASTQKGFLQRLLPSKTTDLNQLSSIDRRLAFAIADLRALGEELKQNPIIGSHTIEMTHQLAAAVDAETAQILGLPPLTDLTLRTDVEGVLGTPSFRLRAQWFRDGRARSPARTGSILATDKGAQRLPLWMLDAVELVDNFHQSNDDTAHWEALARFRKALEPGVELVGQTQSARLSMTDFLSGLEVSLADSLSISIAESGQDFEILPFSSDDLNEQIHPSETMAELRGTDLHTFQQRVRERGALNAYRLGPGRFLVMDRAVIPALKAMTRAQKSPPNERLAFMRNPRPHITEAVEEHLRQQTNFDDLPPIVQEETIDNAVKNLLIETEEFMQFSDRVTGSEVYTGNPVEEFTSSGTTWLPETFTHEVKELLESKSVEELEAIQENIEDMIGAGTQTVSIDQHEVPATTETIDAIDEIIQRKHIVDLPISSEDVAENPVFAGPVILSTADNYTEVLWRPKRGPRNTSLASTIPSTIRTRLKDHQVESLDIKIKAWKLGMPGILNADEQGLGKTLQTIAFLVWLNEHMKRDANAKKGPFLIVAPTSLLENWEQEVKQHVEQPGLGHLIRLYGTYTAGRRFAGAAGWDTKNGEARLDFSDIERALASGAGHLTWILTTYQTLTNYQHSLGKIPFTTAVFDEIQNIKNPGTLAANAARAMNADFRIGLTGTPIENKTTDLWAIMDQLTPGALGSMSEFREKYGTPNERNMLELYNRVFCAQNDLSPLAFRRLKETVATDLPEKRRYLHPRLMPQEQAKNYEEARIKLESGGTSAALKMLHHIRTVSLHPALDGHISDDAFIQASGRLEATFEVLRKIQSSGERALVFIESRQMQHRFIELVKGEFGLENVDLINGDTPILKRQAIVNRFQKHLEDDQGFDLLVLGPKAAGTGLTLTAATHVIHLSRWWNPAVEEQCNDRVHRIGQKRAVSVHIPLAIHSNYQEHSFDILLQSLMQRKRQLATSALWPMGDTSEDSEQLQKMLISEAQKESGNIISSTMKALFERDKLLAEGPNTDGSWKYQ
ncbi:DEAD/DEAH box helicase [Orrella sp. 11846]|uniref:DEAD/DEAH box helicase n=1 Tax=Orrella sp. 11846 TaxID=3409913 RepID=UPI003B5A49B3